MNYIIEFLPYIILILGVAGFLFIEWRKDGKIGFVELTKIVEVAVKAAELRYIKSGGDVNRASIAMAIITDLIGSTLSDETRTDINDIMDAVINDLPKTSERLKKE